MVAVMTLHSLSEGLGIGVSFTGKDGAHLGAFISGSARFTHTNCLTLSSNSSAALRLQPDMYVNELGQRLWRCTTSRRDWP